jgi:hypothetical protein
MVKNHLRTWMLGSDAIAGPDAVAAACEGVDAIVYLGGGIIWGVSRNIRRWWSLAEGEAIGYFPKDDAEVCMPMCASPSSASPTSTTTRS